MSERIVNDPSQHGWVDLGNGKWGWAGEGSGGGGDIDLSGYVSKTEQNDVEEGVFRLTWDHSSDPDFPFNGSLGYSGTNMDPDSPGGSFLYAKGDKGTVSIGRDGDMELHGQSEIRGVSDRDGNLPWLTDFSYVQAADFRDADGNSIIGTGDDGYDDSQIKADLAQETDDRIAGDTALQGQIDNLSVGGGGNDPRITDTQISNWDVAHGWGDHNSKGYLTSVSLNGYATESWVTAGYQPKGSYLTSADLTGYATQTWVSNQGYATTTWVNNQGFAKGAIPTKTSQLSNDSGFVTSSHTHNYAPNSAGNGISIANNQIKMSGSYTGAFSATGDITAYSDEKLKENIVTAPLGILDNLRGVEFTWKEDGRIGSGVIAQEVEELLPHLIHDHEDGHKSVNYNGLVGYLIEEVKSLKAELEAMRVDS
jgi:hypothetical protein